MNLAAVVVGAGNISNLWFPALTAENVRVPAVVDIRLEAARAQIERYQLEADASTDLVQTLTRVRPDFVVDLTVPEAHCTVTTTALRAGCHVIGEKPMAATMDEARAMVRAAQETGRVYMVSQTRRWDPKHAAVRHGVLAGTIGPGTTINCDFYLGGHFTGFRTEMPSPLLVDMAVHHFDMARFMSGTDPVSVYAYEFSPRGSWFKGNAAATCIFEMTGGVVFTYRGSWCSEGFSTGWNGSWRIVGERGTIIYERDEDPYCQVVAENTGFQRPVANAPLPLPAMDATAWRGALCEMLEYLHSGRRPQTECYDNIKSLAMVIASVESSRVGQRVRVETM